MVINLILNSVDAMPNGGVLTIKTQAVEGGVQLDVIDTGMGMTEDVKHRIFEPFFTTKMTVGPGLGLSTVYSTLTSWGGHIEVDSTLGEGTTMSLFLPTWEVADSLTNTVSPKSTRSGRVFVVDDDKIVCLVLSRMLSENHTLDAVQDAHEALAQFEAGRYDVAFIDQGMSGLPGHEVAQRIRQLDPHIATILITGWEILPEDPRRIPFDFHLQKPFENMDILLDILSEAIALHDQRKNEG